MRYLIIILLLSGCATTQYEWSNKRCRDKETGRYVKSVKCADVEPSIDVIGLQPE